MSDLTDRIRAAHTDLRLMAQRREVEKRLQRYQLDYELMQGRIKTGINRALQIEQARDQLKKLGPKGNPFPPIPGPTTFEQIAEQLLGRYRPTQEDPMTKYSINDVKVGDRITLTGDPGIELTGDIKSLVWGNYHRSLIVTLAGWPTAIGLTDNPAKDGWTIKTITRDGKTVQPGSGFTRAFDGIKRGDLIIAQNAEGRIAAGQVAEIITEPDDQFEKAEFLPIAGYADENPIRRVRKITRTQLEALLDPPQPEYRQWTEDELVGLPAGSLLIGKRRDYDTSHALALQKTDGGWMLTTNPEPFSSEVIADESQSNPYALVYRPDMPTIVQGVPREISDEQVHDACVAYDAAHEIVPFSFHDGIRAALRAVGHTIGGYDQ